MPCSAHSSRNGLEATLSTPEVYSQINDNYYCSIKIVIHSASCGQLEQFSCHCAASDRCECRFSGVILSPGGTPGVLVFRPGPRIVGPKRRPPPDDPLHHPPVRGRCRANPHPEVHLPRRRHVQVDRRKDLLLLVSQQVEVPRRSIGGVILHPTRHLFPKF